MPGLTRTDTNTAITDAAGEEYRRDRWRTVPTARCVRWPAAAAGAELAGCLGQDDAGDKTVAVGDVRPWKRVDLATGVG
jgi:hypothetical protein